MAAKPEPKSGIDQTTVVALIVAVAAFFVTKKYGPGLIDKAKSITAE
jgi:hypothetical protein